MPRILAAELTQNPRLCPARTSALEGASETTWRKALFYKWGNRGWEGDTASQRQALVFLSPFYRCRNGGTDTGREHRNPDIQSGTLSNLSPDASMSWKRLGRHREGTFSLQ